MNWLSNPQSDYILAAYGIVGFFLIGILLMSWGNYRRARRDWQKLKASSTMTALNDPS